MHYYLLGNRVNEMSLVVVKYDTMIELGSFFFYFFYIYLFIFILAPLTPIIYVHIDFNIREP